MVKNMTIYSCLLPLIGEEIHLAEIARKLRKPHTTLRLQLEIFEKEGIVKKSIKGRLAFFRLNYGHPLLADYITLAEKENLISACRKNLLLKEASSFLRNFLGEDNKALIFGSAAVSMEHRDIDILVAGHISFKNKLPEFEQKFRTEIHLINVKKLSDTTEALQMEILKKHLILQGSEEIIKWLILNGAKSRKEESSS